MADIRDHVRMNMLKGYLNKFDFELKRTYHNATINDWPEIEDCDGFDDWLGFEIQWLCSYIEENVPMDVKICSFGRGGATLTDECFYRHCGRRGSAQDWAYDRDIMVDISEIDDHTLDDPEVSLLTIKHAYETIKFINDSVEAAAADVRARWEEHKRWESSHV